MPAAATEYKIIMNVCENLRLLSIENLRGYIAQCYIYLNILLHHEIVLNSTLLYNLIYEKK